MTDEPYYVDTLTPDLTGTDRLIDAITGANYTFFAEGAGIVVRHGAGTLATWYPFDDILAYLRGRLGDIGPVDWNAVGAYIVSRYEHP